MAKFILLLFFFFFSIKSCFANDIKIGLLILKNDPRYDEKFSYARIPLVTKNDPLLASSLALLDMKIILEAKKFKVHVTNSFVDKSAVLSEVDNMLENGIKYLVLDLPDQYVEKVGLHLKDKEIIILNTTARDDRLRFLCFKNMVHIAASNRMISDALAQYVLKTGYKNILALHGNTKHDLENIKSFQLSSKRLGLKIVDIREFSLSTNPKDREMNNIALLTGGSKKYDFVFVADQIGEFSRYLSYQTSKPRPVIGSAGLVASEWHWSLERYGAPQVNSRFEDLTPTRTRMSWQDWTIWQAFKAIISTNVKFIKTKTSDPMEKFLSNKLRLDGSLGRSLNFREWSKQYRMPLLLSTQNAIIKIAPLDGFLHKSNTLDTLGYDKSEFSCK